MDGGILNLPCQADGPSPIVPATSSGSQHYALVMMVISVELLVSPDGGACHHTAKGATGGYHVIHSRPYFNARSGDHPDVTVYP